MALGTIKKWKTEHGYGFINADEGGPDVFIHATDIIRAARELVVGDRVEFDEAQGTKGPKAVNCRLCP